ncbi:transketolase [Salibacterium halotolerans]|uniref:Transketolase n=1 Tax=Salibacterium halotolerans TaxID=1884432 RepID=A0A1I5TQ18_9BACI|nr:transketolase [Salibacterium halotolerans]SFP85113.1 transketolase [Salibacterium halotolerans]
MSHFTEEDKLAVQTIRTLAMDAVENAQSGHPGMPMGAAPMAYTLWSRFFKTDPGHPDWINRDRFVLSAGHGSMLLYSLLHLSGYDISLDDLKQFRSWGSKTPGHPESADTPGVDATTGPLGQGVAMAVGMAMAERKLASLYNDDKTELIDHYTYAICGDGDLMEGVSAEAASLAGHLQLGKMILLYDSNDISLDGDLNRSFSENPAKRFEAYGWHVQYIEDGEDMEAVEKAIKEAQSVTDKPSFIEVKTVIGFGAPNKSGSAAAHGAALGADEVQLAKEAYGWPFEEPFFVPDQVYTRFHDMVKKPGQEQHEKWQTLLNDLEQRDPEKAGQFKQALNKELPPEWDASLPVYQEDDKPKASRAVSGDMIQEIARTVPEFFGGSADLGGSNKTHINDTEDFGPPDYTGKNVWFGVREFAMAAALNGIALHGGLKAFAGTFFVFSDYLRPAIRMASIMKLPVNYVFTHDSIAVGEDGPTHEPIEQLPSMRAIPGISVIRPADGNETRVAWKQAMETKDHPTALVLTRQNLPVLPGTAEKAEEGVKRGAYVVSEAAGEPEALLLASGSEVSLAVEAQNLLEQDNISVRVVSVPSWDLFEQQAKAYRRDVIPPHIKARLAVEMASPFGWERYTGEEGDTLGIETFGASAAGPEVVKQYGFTPENVASKLKALL